MTFTRRKRCGMFRGPIYDDPDTIYQTTDMCRGRFIKVKPEDDDDGDGRRSGVTHGGGRRHETESPCEIVVVGFVDNYNEGEKKIISKLQWSLTCRLAQKIK